MPRWLERIILGDARDDSMWVPVGHPDPGSQVQIFLEGFGDPVDVTCNNIMVDLHPFTYAIALGGDAPIGQLGQARLSLVIREPRLPHAAIGRIRLRFRECVELLPHRIGLFETDGCTNRCIHPLRLRVNYLYERVRLFLDRNPYNEKMKPSELFSCWISYCLPRPVHLVSFMHEGRGNIFPMDLVGQTASPYYLLGLHRIRPSLKPLLASGRVAVAAIPPEYTSIALGLGKNHRAEAIDWSALPFAITSSTAHGIPVPREAVTVREVEIRTTRQVGNHVVLVTTTTHLERWTDGPQMCLVHRLYQSYLRRRGRALSSVPKDRRRPSGGLKD